MPDHNASVLLAELRLLGHCVFADVKKALPVVERAAANAVPLPGIGIRSQNRVVILFLGIAGVGTKEGHAEDNLVSGDIFFLRVVLKRRNGVGIRGIVHHVDDIVLMEGRTRHGGLEVLRYSAGPCLPWACRFKLSRDTKLAYGCPILAGSSISTSTPSKWCAQIYRS